MQLLHGGGLWIKIFCLIFDSYIGHIFSKSTLIHIWFQNFKRISNLPTLGTIPGAVSKFFHLTRIMVWSIHRFLNKISQKILINQKCLCSFHTQLFLQPFRHFYIQPRPRSLNRKLLNVVVDRKGEWYWNIICGERLLISKEAINKVRS